MMFGQCSVHRVSSSSSASLLFFFLFLFFALSLTDSIVQHFSSEKQTLVALLLGVAFGRRMVGKAVERSKGKVGLKRNQVCDTDRLMCVV